MLHEVAIPRRRLLGALLVLSSVIAFSVGWVDSPRTSQGHPLLLTRENLALKRYLERAVRWSREMGQAQQQLAGILPAAGAAVSAPADLYRRAQITREQREHLAETVRQIERDDTPAALRGLHALAVQAGTAHTAYAGAALELVAMPDVQRRDALASRQAQARDSLLALRQALAQQTGQTAGE